MLSLLFVRDVRAAAMISGIETFTKIALYFIHERVWTKVPFLQNTLTAEKYINRAAKLRDGRFIKVVSRIDRAFLEIHLQTHERITVEVKMLQATTTEMCMIKKYLRYGCARFLQAVLAADQVLYTNIVHRLGESLFIARVKASVQGSAESRWRSVFKGLSWRVLASLDTTLIVYLITGNALKGIGIGATEILTKLPLFWVHERVWLHTPWGYAPHFESIKKESA